MEERAGLVPRLRIISSSFGVSVSGRTECSRNENRQLDQQHTHHAHGLNRAILLPAGTDPCALTLATLRPHQVGSTNGDESHTDTGESHLLAQQGSDEEYASSGDEEIAGAAQVGAT